MAIAADLSNRLEPGQYSKVVSCAPSLTTCLGFQSLVGKSSGAALQIAAYSGGCIAHFPGLRPHDSRHNGKKTVSFLDYPHMSRSEIESDPEFPEYV